MYSIQLNLKTQSCILMFFFWILLPVKISLSSDLGASYHIPFLPGLVLSSQKGMSYTLVMPAGHGLWHTRQTGQHSRGCPGSDSVHSPAAPVLVFSFPLPALTALQAPTSHQGSRVMPRPRHHTLVMAGVRHWPGLNLKSPQRFMF